MHVGECCGWLTCLLEDIELSVQRLLASVTTMAGGNRDEWEYWGGSCLCGYTVKITNRRSFESLENELILTRWVDSGQRKWTDCVSVRRRPWRAAGSCGRMTVAWAAGARHSAAARTAPAATLPDCLQCCWWQVPSAPAMCSNLDVRTMMCQMKNAWRIWNGKQGGWTLTLCDGHDSRKGHYEVGGLLVHVVGCMDVGQGADWRKTSAWYRDLWRKCTNRMTRMLLSQLFQLYSYLKKVSEPWQRHRTLFE